MIDLVGAFRDRLLSQGLLAPEGYSGNVIRRPTALTVSRATSVRLNINVLHTLIVIKNNLKNDKIGLPFFSPPGIDRVEFSLSSLIVVTN